MTRARRDARSPAIASRLWLRLGAAMQRRREAPDVRIGLADRAGQRARILGGAQGTVTYNYTNATDGSIVMSAFGTVTYTGLAPITNTGARSM